MTIFIKAAKLLMLHCLDHSMESASAKNLGWTGYLRNTDLSRDQNNLTLKLRKFIEDFIPEDSDEKSLGTIKNQISAIDKEVEEVRKHYKFPRGNLNETLTKMNSDLERFYNTILSLPFSYNDIGLAFKLIDIADDNNPFHILCANAAYYFGENIFNPNDESAVKKAVISVVGSSPIDVRMHKENCLLKHLYECDKKLKAVKEGAEFDDLRKQFVINEIEAIQRENTQICKEAQPITTMPMSITFFARANVKAPTLKPSRGRLEVCMNNALEAISSLTKANTESLSC